MEFLRSITGQRAPAISASMNESEEMLAEVDEPPEHVPFKIAPTYIKATPSFIPIRRESLLTRQLHSETEHTDDDAPLPVRALSTHSTWSTYSTASTADLTSDDGRSVASPAVSPPLLATYVRATLPVPEKALDKDVQIIGQDTMLAVKGTEGTRSEQVIEANLGRKRCISFACGGQGKEKAKPSSPPLTATQPKDEPKDLPASPPKRRCALKFVCPTKADPTPKPAKRAVSPPPPPSKTASRTKSTPVKVHRGSDSTVTHTSPMSVRRTPVTSSPAVPSITTDVPALATVSKLSHDSDDSGTEATRFHAFGASEDEPEEWVQESTCHRSRLTISDTLKKENVIRKACEEVEEEVIDDEGDDEDEMAVAGADGLDIEDGDEDDDHEQDDDDEESEGSDEGFHSDNEEGFAASDSEGEDSENEWWRPGGRSTAATSVEHLDRITIHKADDGVPASSIGSVSSAQSSHRASRHHRFHRNARKARHTDAVSINRPDTPNLPDSTDFVCGTLDEDRPLEQAYLNCIKTREAAKHKARPQDIDPSFPTSDPEMDEEDDEDLVQPEESEHEDLMHGHMDDMSELDVQTPLVRRPSLAPLRKGTARSPPPPRHHSPPPKRRVHQSPPPTKRATAKTSPLNKLFGRSPIRARSPAPGKRLTSRPRASPNDHQFINAVGPFCLAQRTHLTHTASLPRAPGLFLSRMHGPDDVGGSDTAGTDAPKRGAIDIVRGLEKKRQRRKEKLYQKACAKAATKGEKTFRVKPGRGAERMRELGLELQRYHGKGEFILSA